MKKQVLKFPLDKLQGLADGHFTQKIEMPQGAIIRTVQMQGETITLWAECKNGEDVETEKRDIEVYGTGRNIGEHDVEYIGTVQERGYVWHVYENK